MLSSSYKFHLVANFAFQHGKILVQLFRGYLGVMLCGGNLRMPQHLAHALYRHTVRNSHHRIRVAAHVEGQMLVYPTFRCNLFQQNIRPAVPIEIEQAFSSAERFGKYKVD